MRTYSALGDQIVVGYITGKQGQYEVFHRSPHSHDLYFRNSATKRSTSFRVKSNGNYIGPDGADYYNNASVIAVAIPTWGNINKIKFEFLRMDNFTPCDEIARKPFME